MRFAVGAELFAIGIDDHHGVEKTLPGALEHRDRQHQAKLPRQRRETRNRLILRQRHRQMKIRVDLVLAEIGRLEQFLDQNDIRPLPRRLTDQPLGGGNVGLSIGATFHLRGGNGDVSHG